MALESGTPIGRYRVEALIGAGGMGEVYRVADTSTGETLALKTLPRGTVVPRVWERFLNEATIQSQLSHPAIAAFREMFLWGGHPCLVMEYVAGQTLDERLAGAGPLSPSEAVGLLGPICDALSYLHAMGILHRDLKSSNVKLLPEGSVKLIDFGIARFRSAGRLTQIGMVAGTPELLAPELLSGQPADEVSEVWSVGMLAYEMLTRRLPFGSGSPEEVCRQILEDTPPLPSQLNAAVPPELDRVIMRCLNKAPARRYRSCAEVGRALRRVSAGTQETRASAARAGASWMKRAVLAAGLTLALWMGLRGLSRLWESAEGAQTVTIESIGGTAEVYENGRAVGHTPYSRRARSGEIVRLELRREGSQPQPVEFEVSQRKVYSYSLSPANQ